MSSNNQITKRQHYVPQFYLSLFTDVKGMIYPFDLEGLRICKPKPPKSICYKPYYYAKKTGEYDEVCQPFEQGLSEIENDFAQWIPMVIDKILSQQQILESDKEVISLVMSMLMIRGEEWRGRIAEQLEGLLRHSFKFMFTDTPIGDKILDEVESELGENKDFRTYYKKMIFDGSYNLEIYNHFHLNFIAQELIPLARLFYAQRWTIYVNKSMTKFITSDNPVSVLIPQDLSRGYGYTFLERTHYFSLTPEIMIKSEGIRVFGQKNVVRKTLYEKDSKIVEELNFRIMGKAMKHIYSNNSEYIKAIKSIIQRS